MNDLEGKVALVTAGSRGLGSEIVRQLIRDGANVAFTYVSNAEASRHLVDEMRASKKTAMCKAIRANATDFGMAQKVVAQVRAEFGKLDILVCNAGVAREAPIWKMSEEEWDEVIGVTLKGSFNYVRAVSPIFREQGHGKIVLIGSINGLRGRMGTVSYNVAKAGLTGLAKTTASELGRFNVNVNVVAPGFIETPSQEKTPELIRDLVLKESAIKRLATPEDVAPMVIFLCSESSRHVTGQVIKVDGGQYL